MLKFSSVLAFVAVVVCALLASAVMVLGAGPKWHQLEGYTFDKFRADFGRRYVAGTSEYKMREKLFLSAMAKIKKHNSDETQSWKMGINGFTDMTPAEYKGFSATFKKSKLRTAPKKVVTGREGTPSGWAPPKEVDWVKRGAVTAVKSQGQCGSCWAHSGIESMESYYFLSTGKLSVLAAQQMNSCTPAPYSYGCGGGDYAEGWAFINSTGIPLTEEWAYPYTDFWSSTTNPTTSPCYNITSKWIKPHQSWFAVLTQVGIDGYNSVTVNDAAAATAALAMVGPQSISIAAGNWQWYEDGVFTNTPANGEDNEWSIDHAVQCVGYGVETTIVNNSRKETGYWLVRNSWTTQWGVNGYIKLWRALPENGEVEPCSPASYGPVCGTSGILSDMQYPLVKDVAPLPF